jgi:hypothetical protein
MPDQYPRIEPPAEDAGIMHGQWRFDKIERQAIYKIAKHAKSKESAKIFIQISRNFEFGDV